MYWLSRRVCAAGKQVARLKFESMHELWRDCSKEWEREPFARRARSRRSSRICSRQRWRLGTAASILSASRNGNWERNRWPVLPQKKRSDIRNDEVYWIG